MGFALFLGADVLLYMFSNIYLRFLILLLSIFLLPFSRRCVSSLLSRKSLVFQQTQQSRL